MIGNNTPCRIASIGRIIIKLFDESVGTLDVVRYVPDLKKNIISLSTLDLKGYKFISERGVLKVCRGALKVLQRPRSHNRMSCKVLQNL